VFAALLAMAAVIAGAVASVAGFGIGSILTPLLSIYAGTKAAVAAVSIPHLVGTLVRFWFLRRDVNRQVLVHFGVWSAAGGLAGALLHSAASNPVLSAVLAGLLVFAGASALTGFSGKMRFGRRVAWFAGAVSGLLGGLVGNQGGIRSAALLGFALDRQAFVATATAIGLAVDAARVPLYLAADTRGLVQLWPLIALSSAGVLAGTLWGQPLLRRIPEPLFHRVIGALLLGLGGFMLLQAFSGAGFAFLNHFTARDFAGSRGASGPRLTWLPWALVTAPRRV
jgi:uncharacterized membrane protein YfcA